MINLTQLDLDIEKRSARLLMPYFSVDCKFEEDAETLMGMGSVENMVVSRDGLKITAYIWYDYGSLIPDSVWNIFGMDSLMGMVGEETCNYYTGQAVLEYVKKLYPMVQKSLQKAASELKIGSDA